jgi:3-deoxy-7-phosphoheptulonate synthase
MILITLKDEEGLSEIIEKIKEKSASFKITKLYGKTIIVAWPDNHVEDIKGLSVENVYKIKKSYPLASRDWRNRDTIVEVENIKIGAHKVVIAAGPCSVESEDQVIEVAKKLKKLGVAMLRGGAFKPRTSPYSFQGLGENGLKILKKVYEEVGMPIVSEIMDPRDIKIFNENVQMLQIGARNSQNYPLLKEAGKSGKPVLLKRGFGNTVEEWLQSAEYILLEGNGSLVLCERGIRSFEHGTRFTLDIGGAILAKKLTHLPICVDPSHPAGKRDLVAPLALASVAAGIDMLLIEVHHNPEKALSDSEQQLTMEEFSQLIEKLREVARAIGRDL